MTFSPKLGKAVDNFKGAGVVPQLTSMVGLAQNRHQGLIVFNFIQGLLERRAAAADLIQGCLDAGAALFPIIMGDFRRRVGFIRRAGRYKFVDIAVDAGGQLKDIAPLGLIQDHRHIIIGKDLNGVDVEGHDHGRGTDMFRLMGDHGLVVRWM